MTPLITVAKIIEESQLPPLDAELILSFSMGKSREYLFAHPERTVNRSSAIKFIKLAKRRKKGEPLAYLLGKKEFFGLEFIVNRNVLVPRPETEHLVELALQKIGLAPGTAPNAVLDIGTGSGNVILSVAKHIPSSLRRRTAFFATDISLKALAIAKMNARKHKLDKSIKFLHSDLLDFLKKIPLHGKILILANLPYLSRTIYCSNKQDLRFEPKGALLSIRKGLAHYAALLEQINHLFASSSISSVSCLFEISPEQKNEFAGIAKNKIEAAEIDFYRDFSNRFRVVAVEKERRANCN